jgi:hypothetical protein
MLQGVARVSQSREQRDQKITCHVNSRPASMKASALTIPALPNAAVQPMTGGIAPTSAPTWREGDNTEQRPESRGADEQRDREQRAESREQRAESREQRAETREQRAESRGAEPVLNLV